MDYFISFLNDLATDLFYDITNAYGEQLFQRGACYEFAKIIKHYIPEATIYMSKDHYHCAVKIDDTLYDSKGVITNPQDFYEADEEDYDHMENTFGLELKYLNIAETIIEEMKECNIESIIKKKLDEQKLI